jgi:hypothetical protein
MYDCENEEDRPAREDLHLNVRSEPRSENDVPHKVLTLSHVKEGERARSRPRPSAPKASNFLLDY